MRTNKFAVAITALLFSLGLSAQGVSDSRKESITIGAGDVVHITVFEAPELEQHARVTDSGDVKLTLGGEVHLGGDSANDAARKVEDVLRKENFLLAPHVLVTMEYFATETAIVLGSVRNPAAYPIDTAKPVTDVLALAGGLSETASRKITVKRRGTGEKISYFYSNAANAALDSAPLVYPGDTVFVPRADMIYMIGDFGHPGAYANVTDQDTITVLQALSLAGSTPPNAVPSHAKLIRKQPDGTYARMEINISAMQKGKVADIPLQANDIVYVPFSYLRNVAVGIGSILAAAASASVYQF